MSSFGRAIGTSITFLLLLIVYIFGVGTVALIGKITGKKFLHLAPHPRAPSYWRESIIKKRTKEDYYKPF